MDFIFNVNIYIENVWCGFTCKDSCKRVVEKHFIRDVDYKKLLRNLAEQVIQTTKDTTTNKNLGGLTL